MSGLDVDKYKCLLHDAKNRPVAFPLNGFMGCGIVTCAGGPTYFLNAWIMINVLRSQGCSLPIECWFLGPEEMDDEMIGLLTPLGVACIDAIDVAKRHSVRLAPDRRGWQIKPLAIAYSAFKEVLFIDADNVTTRNPEHLFQCNAYKSYGSLFWPDREPLPKGWQNLEAHENMWNVCGIDYRVEPSFETGQIVIDKQKCWAALNLTLHFNQNSDFYYRLAWGDPATFHFAWLILNQSFGMIPFPLYETDGKVMFQHDVDGSILFQHRSGAKWTWDRSNIRAEGFELHEECMRYRDQLVAAVRGSRA
jgi:hypothetical protein